MFKLRHCIIRSIQLIWHAKLWLHLIDFNFCCLFFKSRMIIRRFFIRMCVSGEWWGDALFSVLYLEFCKQKSFKTMHCLSPWNRIVIMSSVIFSSNCHMNVYRIPYLSLAAATAELQYENIYTIRTARLYLNEVHAVATCWLMSATELLSLRWHPVHIS